MLVGAEHSVRSDRLQTYVGNSPQARSELKPAGEASANRSDSIDYTSQSGDRVIPRPARNRCSGYREFKDYICHSRKTDAATGLCRVQRKSHPGSASNLADRCMSQELIDESDASDETRWRRWARANYVPLADRSLSWPLFVLDEMRRLDQPSAIQPPKLLLRVGTLP